MFELKKIPRDRLYFVQSIALTLLGVLLLLTLSFALIATEAEIGSLKFKDNGYRFLDNFCLGINRSSPSGLRAQGWTCSFSWIILICGLAAVIGGISCTLTCFFSKKLRDSRACALAAKRMGGVLFGASLAAIALTIVYMILGFVVRALFLSALKGSYSYDFMIMKVIKTYAYFPFILMCLFFAANLFVKAFLTETEETLVANEDQSSMPCAVSYAAQPAAESDEIYAAQPAAESEGIEAERRSLLLKYKEMFDSGIFSQEEYEERKKMILDQNP